MDYAISTLVHEVSKMYRMIPAPLIAMQRLGIDIANEWSVFHGKIPRTRRFQVTLNT
jgi:hypothetical protein